MKVLTVLAIILAFATPAFAVACEPTASQMRDYWVRSRHVEETYALQLAKSADQIFTGTVVDVTDLPSGPYVQLAHIKVDKVLKGHPGAITTAKMYLRSNPERDGSSLTSIPACGEVPNPAQSNPYALETYRYLFYVKAGVLLRVNIFRVAPPPLDAAAEVRLLLQHESHNGK